METLQDLSNALETVESNCLFLGGEFNIPGIDWSRLCTEFSGRDVPRDAMLNICTSFSLRQCVSEPTRGNNILDALFANMPSSIQSIHVWYVKLIYNT